MCITNLSAMFSHADYTPRAGTNFQTKKTYHERLPFLCYLYHSRFSENGRVGGGGGGEARGGCREGDVVQHCWVDDTRRS